MKADVSLPSPPDWLVALSVGVPDVKTFLATGAADRESILSRLVAAGLDLSGEPKRVLDWGCGCGRVARHWVKHRDQVELFGCDINPDAIAWCSENLTFGNFTASQVLPPLPFPDRHFDAMYALSVLTHLTLDTQHLWMAELWRVLKPGGIALLTTMGSTLLPTWLPVLGGENSTKVTVDLIDEDMFLCTAAEDGPNATGAMQSYLSMEKIFAPFEIRFYRPRYGIMGIQDTYVLVKRETPGLIFSPSLLKEKLKGKRWRGSIDLRLDGQTRFRALAMAGGIIGETQARMRIIVPDGRFSEAARVPLPDKLPWTKLRGAYSSVEINAIPKWTGPARVDIEITSEREMDGGELSVVHGALF